MKKKVNGTKPSKKMTKEELIGAMCMETGAPPAEVMASPVPMFALARVLEMCGVLRPSEPVKPVDEPKRVTLT